MNDDLPFSVPDPDPSRPERPARKCFRHQWANGGYHHNQAIAPDLPEFVWDPMVAAVTCLRCGHVRDEAVVKRNRNNRKRGSSFERDVAKQLGGRRTGPLGGRDDVMVGQFAAVQTKKDTSTSLNKARLYLTDLGRTFPDRVPLVIHANPGRNPEPVVILPLATWLALHGPIEEDAHD